MSHSDEALALAVARKAAFYATCPAAGAAAAIGAWTAWPGFTVAAQQRVPYASMFAGGIFTCPRSGLYRLSFNLYVSIVAGVDHYGLFSVNGAPGAGGTTYGEAYFNNTTAVVLAMQFQNTVVLPLVAGDVVRPYYFAGGANNLNAHAGYFSGHEL